MKILLSLLLSLFVGPSLAVESATSLFENTAATGHYVLSAEQWARPRSGQAVLAMPPVRAAVQQLLNTPGGQLLIRYPGGDEGSIWAEELQNWLISLGIEPTLIEMRPGSIPAQIELQIMTTASVKE
ncbi:hypothetical protein [Sulfuriflexus mobilis]|uniref:hypothetical protein n=1 Tax=Sulfuriflexus mobilis TaxID=1811807 RepID=UPI000F83CAA6|nr:hypothetical protein [Sulfuriflexus mobilis]